MSLFELITNRSQGRAAAVLLVALAGIGAGASATRATPTIALKEANNCQGCHEAGRSQRPFLERRCTLDCQGCHIDPAGGGPRNQWGEYYETMEAAPVRLVETADPLRDESRFDVHYDGRVIRRAFNGAQRTFPMANEVSLRLRPFVRYVHLTYEAVMLGRIGDADLRVLRGDDRRFRENYAAMIDNLPLNTYLRAYRGTPMYGLRRSNHTLWIRERLGLDQFATTEAVEAGTTPNVPFFRTSVMRGDPYASPEDRQKGQTFHGGMRGVSYGWHINGSAWDTASEKARIRMRALGVGLKPWKFVFMAERNWRQVTSLDAPAAVAVDWRSAALKLQPSSTISQYEGSFTGIPGVITGYVLEELHDEQSTGLRRSLTADFHLIPFLQFEVWRRFETGTRRIIDTLAILHAYVDI